MLTEKEFWNVNVVGVTLSCALAVLLSLGCEWQPIPVVSIQPQADATAPIKISRHPEGVIAETTSTGLPLKLTLRVEGFANDNGVCRVAVYLGKAHFNDPEFAIAKESIAVLGSKAEVLLELEIPNTTCELVSPNTMRELSIAVSAFHDENDNAQLDKSSFGIPIERYGFSTNPKRGFGPPKFSEAAIELNTAKLQSELESQLDIPITIK